jgi:hypothetical protein
VNARDTISTRIFEFADVIKAAIGDSSYPTGTLCCIHMGRPSFHAML